MNFLRTAPVLALTLSFATGAFAGAPAKPDGQLTCPELVDELHRMDRVISGEKGASTTAHIAGAGAAIGEHAAMLGGNHVPFVGGIFGGLANMKKQQAEMTIQEAQMRQNTLNGIYIGKGCEQQVTPAVNFAPAEQVAPEGAVPAPAPSAADTQAQTN